MAELLTENRFHIAFYAASIMTCLTVLAYTCIQKRTDRRQNRVFLLMLFIILLNAGCTTAAALSDPFRHVSGKAFDILQTAQFFYFFIHTALAPAFYVYVLCVTGAIRKRNRTGVILTSFPCIVTEFLCLINPLFHWVFYYDTNREFHRNWAEYLIYLAAALYFLLAMVNLLHSWNAITARRKLALLYFFALSLAGILLQLVFIDIKSELFAESLAMMGLMLAVEGEEDRLDQDMGVYNRRALRMDLENYLIRREEVSLLIVKIIDEQRVARATGSSNSDNRDMVIANYLKTLVPWYRIYKPGNACFVLFSGAWDYPADTNTAEKITARFQESWQFGGTELLIDAVVFHADVPGDLEGISEVMYAVDSIIPPSVNKNDANIDYLTRRAEIERIIRQNADAGQFEVYYQPTYHVDGKRIHGAEALVRMKPDEKLGYISPEEFIPIAEQIGLVEQIDDFVLQEVCAFIAGGIPVERGMDCINVNLSVMQCLRPGFADHLVQTVDRYQIPHEMLNFEITETVDAGDYEILSEVVMQLKQHGFLLSMDDYGTGYSNVGAIFSLDFDVIKIDKSLLWNAEKDEQGRIILEDTVRMISDLGLKILIEGVETSEQVKRLQQLHVDYLQGYFFSRPLPKLKFIAYVSASS